MMSRVALLAVVCLFGLAAAQRSISTTGCGGEVTDVRVNPCASEPCKFKKGDTTEIEIDFTPAQDSDSASLSVSARVFGLDADFPGMEGGADGCSSELGLSCPIRKGVTQTLKMKLAVPSFAPSIKTTATFKLDGASGNLFCFKAPVTVG